MPAAVAADNTELPAGADAGFPSMVIVTSGPEMAAVATGLPDFHHVIG